MHVQLVADAHDPDGHRAAQRAGHIAAGGVEKDVAFIDVVDADDDAIDAAYRDKYARYPSYVPPMLSDQARATTLNLVPRDDEDHA